MTGSGNILIVFPHNFFERKSGVNKRYFELVCYLKEKGYSIDLLGLKHFESKWKTFARDNSNNLINQLFLYNFRIGFNKQRLMSLLSTLSFSKKRNNLLPKNQLPDYAFPGMLSLFNRIVTNKKYDYIIIGYVYWANLLRDNILQDSVSVLTIEDFISPKLIETNGPSFDFTLSAKEEVERVNLFDRVICLSFEELQFFSARTQHPEYYYVPVFLKDPHLVSRRKEYDMMFIGFDNADNKDGLEWFFKQVYPLLNKALKIILTGKIARFAPDLPNVIKIDYADDVSEIYARSKISINPLQKGTGMKVKVIESLAYGIPIVNTSKGLCGMPPDILNQFITADDPQNFADEIHHLMDEKWYHEKCRDAKTLFLEKFEYNSVKNELNKLFS